MAIKLYYNKTTYQLITIDDGGESLVKGDDGSKVFEFYFGTGTALVDFVLDATIPLTHEGRVTFKRADDETTNDVYLTPIAGGFYRYVIGDWVTEVEGDLKITARLKLGEVYTAFGIATIPVEDGVAPDDGSTISQLQYDAIMGTVNDVIIGTTPIAYDNAVSGLAAVDVQGAIDEVDADVDALAVRVTTAETDIDILEGRATNLETFQSTTVPATYETISNVDLVRNRVDDLETFEDVTVPATYETKADATSKLALKVDKTTTIANVAIDNGISLDELKTAIGLATTSISGLMSATDKGYLNELYALLDTDDVDVLVNTLGEILALFENYPEGTDIVTAFAGKVDKVLTAYDTLTGESVVGTEFIYVDAGGTAKKMTLSELFEASNSSAGAFVPNGVYEDLTSGYAINSQSGIDIDEEFIEIDGRLDVVEGDIANIENGTQDITYDNMVSGLTATTVKGAIDEIDNRIDVIESKIDVIGLDYKEYGIREVVGQSASEFERVTRFGGEIKLGSATGLVANVAIDDADATNSFDFIPIFKRDVVDIDATDLSSNTVSNTFVKVPKFYIKEEWANEGGTDYHYIFMSQFKHEGYRLPLPFKREDGTERDYTYIGAYEAYLDGNNKLRSLTGQIPKVSYSRNNFRTAARALDGLGVNSKYQITDLAEYVDLVQIPFMIEFATKHSQGVFLGATSMAYSASHTAIAEGTAVNFIVVSNATGANFVLGQTVSIGTSNSNDSVAKDRIVTQIDIDTPNAGETTITFDGVAVNIAIGNVIASRAWKTGATDQVKVSGTHALNDGKHSIVWRGLENPFGNIWKNVDGVKISNWRGYVAENPKDYNDTASVAGVYAEPYLPLGYLNADTNNYAQDLGYDANYPYAKFPISVQASSGLFFRDYYYQNSGDRTVFVGGYWVYSSFAGMFCWNLSNVLGYTNFIIGARLSYRP